MNKHLLLIASSLLTANFAFAQIDVTTLPMRKAAVLEEYTGVNCQFCPDGHVRAEALVDEFGSKSVIVVNIHGGGFAVPRAGQIDFRTAFGEALITEANVPGFPAGSVNRTFYPDYTMGGGTATDRGAWAAVVPGKINEASPVNIAAKSTFDAVTRELTIEVAAYFTENQSVSSNFLNIAFLENKIIGPQVDATKGNIPNYEHNKVLRHLITGQWGEEVLDLTKGSTYRKTFTYVVPAEFKIENADIAVFMAETRNNIHTGVKIPAVNGESDGTTVLNIGSFNLTSALADAVYTIEAMEFSLDFSTLIEGDQTYTIQISDNIPADWSVSLSQDGTLLTPTADSYTIDLNADTKIQLAVMPGTTPFVGELQLVAENNAYPGNRTSSTIVYAMSNVTEFVVGNSAGFGDGSPGNATKHNKIYVDGILGANNSKTAGSSDKAFVALGDAGKLDNIRAIYYNCAWTFPALTERASELLTEALDRGTGLFISGQDVLFNVFDPGSGIGPKTTALFQKMGIGYLNDGGPTRTVLNIVANIPFYTTFTSPIAAVYGAANLYPDAPSNTNTTSNTVFAKYNDNANAGIYGHLKVDTGYAKYVYLGIGLEHFTNAAKQAEFMKATYDYIHSAVSTGLEIENSIQVQVYPNPSNASVTLNITEAVDIIILDLQGKIVYSANEVSSAIQIPTQAWAAGSYSIQLSTKNGNRRVEKLQIIH